MYWNSEWRTVCYDGWDEFDAQVVCRQVNYLSTSVQILGMYGSVLLWLIEPFLMTSSL